MSSFEDPETLWKKALDREAALSHELAGLRPLKGEVEFLRERLAHADRDREVLLSELRTERERHAEETRELRVLLRSQEQTAALSERLERQEQKALEAATQVPAPRPWWKLWGV